MTRAVAHRHGIGRATAIALVARWAGLVGAHCRPRPCRVLLLIPW